MLNVKLNRFERHNEIWQGRADRLVYDLNSI